MAVYTAINDPSAHFQNVIWTGDGNDDRSINQDGNSTFQPDAIWIKCRSDAFNHYKYDSSRGANNQMLMQTNQAETTVADRMQAFESDGFQLGTSGEVNGDTKTYVAFLWKVNGGTTSSNTSGSITSTVQANTTAGQSILTFDLNGSSGGTVGHGLGAVPDMYVVKNRENVADWQSFWQVLGATKRIQMNDNAAASTQAIWLDTAPTSTVFTVGASAQFNSSADDNNCVAYCFTSIQGYSKFGIYTGNGSVNGPFVYTGFKPAWFMHKRSSGGTNEWTVYNNKSSPHNEIIRNINASTAGAEDAATDYDDVDFLSNGIKIREDNDDINTGTSDTYIYMAFAENPFVTSTGIPCTAR